MLICKQCNEIVGAKVQGKKLTICNKCINRKVKVKGKAKADNYKYTVWGKKFYEIPGERLEELLDFAKSKQDAEEKISKLRKIRYFVGWEFWYELST